MAWALAVSLIFSSITLFFVFMYAALGRPREQQDAAGNSFISDDEHKVIRIGLLGMVGTFMLYLISFVKSIVDASNITDANTIELIDSMAIVIQVVVWIFLVYLLLYSGYYMINKIIQNSERIRRGMR